MSSIKRFLPTDNFHIIPVKGLAPDDLKSSAKAALRDREKIGHLTLLSLLAKRFGVKEGFAGYLKEYETSLKPFMARHALKRHADLLTPRKRPEIGMPNLAFTIEQLCGRIFDSGLSLPERLFTGYSFDYARHYEDVLWEFNQRTYAHYPGAHIRGSDDFWALVNLAESQPDLIMDGSKKRQIDLVVGGLLFDCVAPSFNLMGDLLVHPVKDRLTQPEIYWPLKACQDQKARDIESIEYVGELFRSQLNLGDEGWVEIIPYNQSLVFLKGADGEYDFVIPGLRSTPFEHQIYAPFLKRADVPSQMNEEYHFRRWYYFEYQGWREMDEHLAEQAFYDQGGVGSCYPGTWRILNKYMSAHGKYVPVVEKLQQSSITSDVRFYRVQLDEKALYVSDLISIDEITLFSNRSPDYFTHRNAITEDRQPDELVSMNDDHPALPAAVTWYDACAYMAHFEAARHLPVRLLKTGEYLAIRQQCSGGMSPQVEQPRPPRTVTIKSEEDFRRYNLSRKSDGLLEFSERSGNSYGAHPPYMEEERFQNLMCHYAKPLKYIPHPSGLQFVNSDSFGEWLYENPNGRNAAAVRSKSLWSMYGTSNFDLDLFPAHSTGKYKHAKIGFRLCYLASK